MPKNQACQFCGSQKGEVFKTYIAHLYLYAHDACVAAWCNQFLASITKNNQWRKK
jgi:hypothetical protein